jgi:hypothetical protein
MQIKMFEIRDSMTFIPAIGIAMNEPTTEADRYLLRRSGYALESIPNGGCVLFGRAVGGEFRYDPYDWPTNPRTMRVAHQIVVEQWESLSSGDVLCIEYYLGERQMPKVSESI